MWFDFQVNSRSKHIEVVTECRHAAIPLQYQFRWSGVYGQIESMSAPNFCWSLAHVNETLPFENFYYAKLVIEACNEEVTFQVFLANFAFGQAGVTNCRGRIRMNDVSADPSVYKSVIYSVSG